MAILATSRVNVVDFKDPIISSNTPPINPNGDFLWLDTSVTPNLLKRWDGYNWVVINDISEVKQSMQTLKTDFQVEQGRISGLIQDTTITNSDGSHTKIKDKIFEVESTVDGYSQRITDVEGSIGSVNTNVSELTQTVNGFKTEVSQASTDAANAKSSAEQTANKIALVVKSGTLESNLVLTDGMINATANQINLNGLVTFNGLNSDVKNKINAPKETFDTWSQPVSYENQTTTINGGHIQTGSINASQINVDSLFAKDSIFAQRLTTVDLNADQIVAGTIKSNMIDLYGLSIRHKDTNNETLHISQDGDVTIRGSMESYNYESGVNGWSVKQDGSAEFNDVIVRGSLITTDSGIVGSALDNAFPASERQGAKTIRFWAGASFENREKAPFIVYNDGTFKSSTGSYDGVCTGKVEIGNVLIEDANKLAGGDANIVIQDGNTGVKKVQLSDKEESSFAQDIVITNTFYETKVRLKQYGMSEFSQGIQVSKDTFLNADSVSVAGQKIEIGQIDGTNTPSMVLNSDQVEIGKVNKKAKLLVYGESELLGDVNVSEKIIFKNGAVLKSVSGGLNIDIITE